MKVSVCIASMGRPSLRRTIESVKRSVALCGEAVEILVADDSRDGAAAALLADEDTIRILPVASGNVSRARNACLDAACGEWLLFVDDDEFVAENWLAAHLLSADQCAADVVLAPVYHNYPQEAPGWFRAVDPLFQDWNWSEHGRRIRHGRTGNTLVRRALVEQHGVRFDPRFGRSGGEDHDFFHRLDRHGAIMVVTDLPSAWEDVPIERCTARYILERATRSGQTHALVVLEGASPARRAVFAANALGKLATAALGALVARPFGRAGAFRLEMRRATNFGKLSAMWGGPMRSSWHDVFPTGTP